MENTNFTTWFFSFLTVLITVLLMGTGLIFAHCDTMDGPIIKSSQKALETGDVNLDATAKTTHHGHGTEAVKHVH
jgi:hypothetical protein